MESLLHAREVLICPLTKHFCALYVPLVWIEGYRSLCFSSVTGTPFLTLAGAGLQWPGIPKQVELRTTMLHAIIIGM